MVEGGGLVVGEKALYWRGVHLERFFNVVSKRGGGVKRQSRGGGQLVFGVVASRQFGAGFCAGAGEDGAGCFLSEMEYQK